MPRSSYQQLTCYGSQTYTQSDQLPQITRILQHWPHSLALGQRNLTATLSPSKGARSRARLSRRSGRHLAFKPGTGRAPPRPPHPRRPHPGPKGSSRPAQSRAALPPRPHPALTTAAPHCRPHRHFSRSRCLLSLFTRPRVLREQHHARADLPCRPP